MMNRNKILLILSIFTILIVIEIKEIAGLCTTDPGCIGDCPSPGGCTQCRANYGTDSTGKCKQCSTQPGGCTLCTTMSKCDTCPSGYVPLDPGPGCGACATSCSNCSVSGPGKCDQCNSANYLDPTAKNCTACAVLYCTLCPNSASACSGCKSGYSLIGGVCVQCDLHCSYCVNAGAGKCDPGRCTPGYGINPSTNNTCIACNNGNCSKCEPPTGPCQTCLNAKFQLQSDGTCKAVCTTIANCADCYLSTARCTTCKTGYSLNSTTGQCQGGTTTTLPPSGCIPNCANCSTVGPGQCNLCNSGYYLDPLDPTTCFPICDNHCTNCTLAGPYKCNPGKCSANYGLTATQTCEACQVAYCSQCPTSSSTCNACASGYTLVGGLCQTSGPTTAGPVPLTQTPMTVVTTAGVNCATDPNCASCSSNGTCTMCSGQNGLDATGTCRPCAQLCNVCTTAGAGKCDICSSYTGITANKTCEPCSNQPGCDRCYNMSVCDLCLPGFTQKQPTGPGCVAVTTTKPGVTTTKLGGTTITLLPPGCIPNCVNCSTVGAGQCNLCNSGYYLDPLDPTTCYPICDNHCSNCSSAGPYKCDPGKCEPNYVLTANKTCQPICTTISFCNDCSADPTRCTTCNAPFVVNATTGLCVVSDTTTSSPLPGGTTKTTQSPGSLTTTQCSPWTVHTFQVAELCQEWAPLVDIDKCENYCISKPNCLGFWIQTSPAYHCTLCINGEDMVNLNTSTFQDTYVLNRNCLQTGFTPTVYQPNTAYTSVGPCDIVTWELQPSVIPTTVFAESYLVTSQQDCQDRCSTNPGCISYIFTPNLNFCYLYMEGQDFSSTVSTSYDFPWYKRNIQFSACSTTDSLTTDQCSPWTERNFEVADLCQEWPPLLNVEDCKNYCVSKPNCLGFWIQTSPTYHCTLCVNGEDMVNLSNSTYQDTYVLNRNCLTSGFTPTVYQTNTAYTPVGPCDVVTWELQPSVIPTTVFAESYLATSQQDCQDHCSTNPGCISYIFTPNLNFCYLHMEGQDLSSTVSTSYNYPWYKRNIQSGTCTTV